MLKRTLGVGLVTLLAAAPFFFTARSAVAQPGEATVCYAPNRDNPRLGIVIDVPYDVAERLVRRHRASYNYATTFYTWRGHTICIRLPGK